jgi:hypothetical protein
MRGSSAAFGGERNWTIAAAISAQILHWHADAGRQHFRQRVDGQWIGNGFRMRKGFVANAQNALVVAGQRQPREVHLLAHAINSALGAIGNTVTLLPATEAAGADLKNLDSAAIDTLVILGG